MQKLRKSLEKLAVAVDIDTLEAIRFENVPGWLLTVKFMSSVVGVCQVPETLSSCDIDGRALKRTETFASERKGKLLCSFKQGCCDVSFLTLICVNKYFETEKMYFLK